MHQTTFTFHDLSDAQNTHGVVIVIDVLRAFTTAAFALAQGAAEIRCVGTVEEALALKAADPNRLTMGEIDGYPIPEFDLDNSPTRMTRADVAGKTLIQRTTAGTQGLIRAANAEALLASSLVVASATTRAVTASQPDHVSFIVTGITPDGRGDEDTLCAEVIRDLLLNRPIPSQPDLYARILASKNGQRFADPSNTVFPLSDVELAAELDRFPFAIQAEPQSDGSVRLSKKNFATDKGRAIE